MLTDSPWKFAVITSGIPSRLKSAIAPPVGYWSVANPSSGATGLRVNTPDPLLRKIASVLVSSFATTRSMSPSPSTSADNKTYGLSDVSYDTASANDTSRPAHFMPSQFPLAQSPSLLQTRPAAHLWHVGPPQSVSVSSPFRVPSKHVGPIASGIASDASDPSGDRSADDEQPASAATAMMRTIVPSCIPPPIARA